MKTCECGGTLYRHGESYGGGQRYRCAKCKKCITVRDGQIVDPKAKRMRMDWRHGVAA